MSRYDIAACVAGAIGIAAALSSMWFGQHMIVWSGFAAAALVIFAALAEKERDR
jgi:hypothetical protein|nr:MAG TPA: hypothetical protein [Caudoviricetes sp.]